MASTIRHGENNRQEAEELEWPCFLSCSLLPTCVTPSVTPPKKRRNPFLRLVHAMKISSLFSRTDKKHRRSNTEFVTGTIFRQKTGQEHLHLVIQTDPKSSPLVVLQLASSTDSLREASVDGPLQFLLTCVKKHTSMSIWEEWKWTEHVNGQVVGEALRLISEATNLNFLEEIEHVTCGTGVLPDYEASGVIGELLYMRTEFKKTKLSFDAELLTMVSPDNTGSADISIRFNRV